MTKFLFKIFLAIEILDKWGERALKSYRDYKDQEALKQLEQNALEASKEGSVERLRRRNKNLNG